MLRVGHFAALLALWLAYNARVSGQPIGPAQQGFATFYGGPQDNTSPYVPSFGLVSGACGYGLLQQTEWPYWQAAAIGPGNALFTGGNKRGCGDCIQVTCISGCTANAAPFAVFVTDTCDTCAPSQLNIHSLAFSKYLNSDLVVGQVDVTWQQVACTPPADIKAKIVDFRAGEGGFIAITLLEVAGSGVISAIDIQSLGQADWTPMLNDHGAVWQASNLGGPPFSLRITGDGQQQLIAQSAITQLANGSYPTGVQFGGAGSAPPPAQAAVSTPPSQAVAVAPPQSGTNSSAPPVLLPPSAIPPAAAPLQTLGGVPPSQSLPAVPPSQPPAAAGAAPPQPSVSSADRVQPPQQPVAIPAPQPPAVVLPFQPAMATPASQPTASLGLGLLPSPLPAPSTDASGPSFLRSRPGLLPGAAPIPQMQSSPASVPNTGAPPPQSAQQLVLPPQIAPGPANLSAGEGGSPSPKVVAASARPAASRVAASRPAASRPASLRSQNAMAPAPASEAKEAQQPSQAPRPSAVAVEAPMASGPVPASAPGTTSLMLNSGLGSAAQNATNDIVNPAISLSGRRLRAQ